ncbi:hypothetical protein appser10_20530 [Actinobacillus pleuropneumoniae serovar 10 str. D13039]|nr:hypothetical protein appser10_20530 [Actinobacillus pleuropneumoniae serovar 10 str. D13039]
MFCQSAYYQKKSQAVIFAKFFTNLTACLSSEYYCLPE